MNLAKFIKGRPSVLEEREKRHELVARMVYHFGEEPEIRINRVDASLFKKLMGRIKGGNKL